MFGWKVKKIKRLFLVTLLSVKVKTLGKVTIFGHLGSGFAEWQTFVECHMHGTRQSEYDLSSVMAVTLGKGTRLPSAEVHGTWQTLCHCRVSLTLTLGKDVALLSAMNLALSKATVTMPPLVTATFLCRVSSRHSAKMALPTIFYQASIAKCGTWQSLCRVQYGLCRVSQALSKEPDSRSALSLSHCMQARATPTLVASPISPPQSPVLARLELVPAPWHGSPAPQHVAQVFKSVNLIHAITNCTMVRTTFAIHQLFQTMPL